MNRRALFFAAIAALVGFAITRSHPSPVQLGKPAPSFQLANLSGQAVSLKDYRGKVVLLNFWATWCPDCRQEIPTLQAMYDKLHAKGFEVVAPSVDDDGKRAIVPFVAKAGTTYTILLSDPKTTAAYGVNGIPSSFLIAPDGTVVKHYLGAVEPRELENDILQQLPRRPS